MTDSKLRNRTEDVSGNGAQRVRSLRSPSPCGTAQPVDVSIIACTRNNSGRLQTTLDALSRCRIPEDLCWEIILVDNGSSDDTPRVAAECGERLPLIYVSEPRTGLSRARNAGIRHAGGELLLFTDDDVIPCQEWVTSLWDSYLRLGEMCFLGGPVESIFESAPPDRELLEFAPRSVTGLDLGPESRALDDRARFLGANWACPADAVRKIGGFDPSLGLGARADRTTVGEESDVQRRLLLGGLAAWYVPTARVKHFVPTWKCSSRHIGERAEAYSFISWRHSLADSGDLPGQHWPPTGLILHVARCWLRWVLGKAIGHKAYREYIHFRRSIGRLRAYRDRQRPEPVSAHEEV